MCPIGASHIAIQGIGKIARKLGVDFAEAVVRFRFFFETLRIFLARTLF
jgi:xeroderma pigmentosum group C-complementing protein